MSTAKHDTMIMPARSVAPRTPEAAGELRHRLREHGWRTDLAWVAVGSRSAGGAVRAAGGEDVRRTVAYLPTLRSLDGGAASVWKHGDVPAPPAADVREVMLATDGVDEWISELFEAPPERIEEEHLLR
jgi:hypothetical protein